MRICFATNNLHKLEEIRSVAGNQIIILSLADIGCFEDLPEEQNTLPGNSLQKAEYVFKKFGVTCFADDSGLEVDALNGAPGVDSAHYAGPQRNANDNMDLLLKNLINIENRGAQFRTIITLVTPTVTKQFEGIVRGVITREKIGSEGFGYNPIFMPDGFSRTMAEMTMAEKNQISHRAIATNKLISFLRSHSNIL